MIPDGFLACKDKTLDGISLTINMIQTLQTLWNITLELRRATLSELISPAICQVNCIYIFSFASVKSLDTTLLFCPKIFIYTVLRPQYLFLFSTTYLKCFLYILYLYYHEF